MRNRARQRRPGGHEPTSGVGRLPCVEVTAITRENDSVISLRLDDPSGAPLPAARPVSISRCESNPTTSGGRCCATTRSLDRLGGLLRITVKRERDRVASDYLHSRLTVGDQLEIAAPRGTFILDRTPAPVLLISAGIGATPVLAMLHALAQERSDREIWWLHGARNGREHVFAAEVRRSSLRCRTYGPTFTTATPARMTARAVGSTASASHCVSTRGAPATPRCRGVPVWAHTFMGEISAGLAALGMQPHGSTPSRSAGTGPDAGSPRLGADAPPTHRPTRDGPTITSPAATSRSGGAETTTACLSSPKLRPARPLVMPHRRVPQLRDATHRRGRRLLPRPSRSPR